MAISANIIKFRNENNLSQEQLAQQVHVTQQVLSKWENMESLPDAEDLVNLSDLLDIPIDELISGESYFSLPFDYGRPQNRKPAITLILAILFFVIITPALMDSSPLLITVVTAFLCFCTYSLAVLVSPFDFKSYYNYWTLEKDGIRYANSHLRTPGYKGMMDEFTLPIKALLHIRKTTFVPYSEIKKVGIVFTPFAVSPDRAISTFRYYVPRMQQSMREDLFFELTTKDGKKIALDLRQYYKHHSPEYILLPTIISFLQNKNIEFVDKQNLYKAIKNFEKNFAKNRYTQAHS